MNYRNDGQPKDKDLIPSQSRVSQPDDKINEQSRPGLTGDISESGDSDELRKSSQFSQIERAVSDARTQYQYESEDPGRQAARIRRILSWIFMFVLLAIVSIAMYSHNKILKEAEESPGWVSILKKSEIEGMVFQGNEYYGRIQLENGEGTSFRLEQKYLPQIHSLKHRSDVENPDGGMLLTLTLVEQGTLPSAMKDAGITDEFTLFGPDLFGGGINVRSEDEGAPGSKVIVLQGSSRMSRDKKYEILRGQWRSGSTPLGRFEFVRRCRYGMM